MSFTGAGTQSSPIALDDSEDEVLYELSKNYSSKSSPILETHDAYQRRTTSEITFDDLQRNSETRPSEKKRKRGNSFASQDMPVAGTSHGQKQQQRNHPSLVNRLSQPESKKARKRRRKAERQAQEEARLKNIDWLNNANQFVNPVQAYPLLSPHMSWSNDHQVSSDPGFSLMASVSTPMSMPSEGIFPRRFLSYNDSNRYQEEATFNDSYNSRSPSPPRVPTSIPPTPTLDPPPSTSEWVSAMAMAAEGSTSSKTIDIPTPHWSPMPTELSLPPAHPPPLPPPPPQTYGINPKLTTTAEFHHALPPKPPPPQPVQPIGMKPDQDPNSKHGIFHITSFSKEAGTATKKKRKEQYIPNPARTLVMEQLPKTHRQPEFINKWSRSACSALPVHLFIDGPNAKALIEFATAELARKAWCSPKLGSNYSGLKPHQLKGKPREDLIKVWWYRVDGVGAGAGVGEIEEGEIEGDAAEKDSEVNGSKETKKERKARLAREREEKRLAREVELKAMKELQTQQQQQQQQQQLPTPSPPPPVINAVPNPSQNASIPQPYAAWQAPLNSHAAPFQPRFANYSSSSLPSFGNFPWVQVATHPPINKTAYGASMLLRNQGDHDDNESIASSVASSASNQHDTKAPGTTAGQGDILSDFEEEADMDVDEDISDTPIPPQPLQPLQPPPAPPLLHSSLPPRPPPPTPIYASKPTAQRPVSRPPPQPSSATSVFVPKIPPRTLPPQPQPQPQPQHLPQPPAKAPPQSAVHTRVVHHPQPQVPPTFQMSESSVDSHIPETALTPVPSEPKAMKNAPTEPSFTKRALMARKKELEEKISKSKLELAAASASESTTPHEASLSLPARPPLDNDEKQAMEDRLRTLVLKSQRAKAAKPVPKIEQPEPPATVSTPVMQDPPTREGDNTTPAASSTISVSAHDFSLEDLAVSFITQTIETAKAHPNSVKPSAPAVKPAPSHLHVKNELAAKQKRLEQHILETKSLMTRLSQSRSKEEKEILLKIMREKTRIYEEETKMATSTSTSSTSTSFPTGQRNNEATSVVNKTQSATPAQQQHTTRWPVNWQQDVGVLMISDDEDEDEDEDEEE